MGDKPEYKIFNPEISKQRKAQQPKEPPIIRAGDVDEQIERSIGRYGLPLAGTDDVEALIDFGEEETDGVDIRFHNYGFSYQDPDISKVLFESTARFDDSVVMTNVERHPTYRKDGQCLPVLPSGGGKLPEVPHEENIKQEIDIQLKTYEQHAKKINRNIVGDNDDNKKYVSMTEMFKKYENARDDEKLHIARSTKGLINNIPSVRKFYEKMQSCDPLKFSYASVDKSGYIENNECANAIYRMAGKNSISEEIIRIIKSPEIFKEVNMRNIRDGNKILEYKERLIRINGAGTDEEKQELQEDVEREIKKYPYIDLFKDFIKTPTKQTLYEKIVKQLSYNEKTINEKKYSDLFDQYLVRAKKHYQNTDINKKAQVYEDTFKHILPEEYEKRAIRDVIFAEKIKNFPNDCKIIVFGDMHGSGHAFVRNLLRLIELGRIRKNFIIEDNYRIFFLGDLVDRGLYAPEIVYIVMKLKLNNWDKVFVVKGNHEEDGKDMIADFADQIVSSYSVDIFLKILYMWNYVPVALFLEIPNSKNNYIQFCHGGFYRYVEDIQTFLKDNRQSVFIVEKSMQIKEDKINVRLGPDQFDFKWSDFECGGIDTSTQVEETYVNNSPVPKIAYGKENYDRITDAQFVDDGAKTWHRKGDDNTGKIYDHHTSKIYMEKCKIMGLIRGHQDKYHNLKLIVKDKNKCSMLKVKDIEMVTGNETKKFFYMTYPPADWEKLSLFYADEFDRYLPKRPSDLYSIELPIPSNRKEFRKHDETHSFLPIYTITMALTARSLPGEHFGEIIMAAIMEAIKTKKEEIILAEKRGPTELVSVENDNNELVTQYQTGNPPPLEEVPEEVPA